MAQTSVAPLLLLE